jgi:hypothetical protein
MIVSWAVLRHPVLPVVLLPGFQKGRDIKASFNPLATVFILILYAPGHAGTVLILTKNQFV